MICHLWVVLCLYGTPNRGVSGGLGAPVGRYSDLLYAEPSFLEGIARVTDLGATLEEYNTSPSGELADFYAIRSDWRQVGEDLSEAFYACATEMDRHSAVGERKQRARRR